MPQRSDSGTRGGWRSDNRPNRREATPLAPRYSTNRDFSRRDFSRPADGRYSERGYSQRGYAQRGYSERNDSQRGNRGNWGGRSDGYRRNDRGWRGSYGGGYRGTYGYRRGYPSYGYRPYYRHGYFYGHGYYFPRYYFDIESYPAYAAIRTLVGPAETEVYVDGYYAGVVDDFDGLFQRLCVAPGRHEITLRLDGFLTWGAEVFAAPGQTIDLHHDMVPGASGPEPGVGDDPGRYEDPGAYGPPPADEPPGSYEDPGPPQQ